MPLAEIIWTIAKQKDCSLLFQYTNLDLCNMFSQRETDRAVQIMKWLKCQTELQLTRKRTQTEGISTNTNQLLNSSCPTVIFWVALRMIRVQIHRQITPCVSFDKLYHQISHSLFSRQCSPMSNLESYQHQRKACNVPWNPHVPIVMDHFWELPLAVKLLTTFEPTT